MPARETSTMGSSDWQCPGGPPARGSARSVHTTESPLGAPVLDVQDAAIDNVGANAGISGRAVRPAAMGLARPAMGRGLTGTG